MKTNEGHAKVTWKNEQLYDIGSMNALHSVHPYHRMGFLHLFLRGVIQPPCRALTVTTVNVISYFLSWIWTTFAKKRTCVHKLLYCSAILSPCGHKLLSWNNVWMRYGSNILRWRNIFLLRLHRCPEVQKQIYNLVVINQNYHKYSQSKYSLFEYLCT